MSAEDPAPVRVVALVGPTGAGKTTLMEAMLLASGAAERRNGGGLSQPVGDASPEAKSFGRTVELTLAGFGFLGDRYTVIDCPGAVDFAADADFALPAVDLAIVVADPDPARALLLQPALKALEDLGVPRIVFVNRIDQARGALGELLEALAAVSAVPVVARHLPIWEGGHVTGFVDLALERAFQYREGQPSRRIDLPRTLAEAEPDARFQMLETLADFDDALLEQLLSDEAPAPDTVFGDLARELNAGLILPVFFGAAAQGFGVRRLLKALRHEIRPVDAARARLGAEGPCAYVLKCAYGGQAGLLAYARALGGGLAGGAELTLPDGERGRVGGLFLVQGPAQAKTPAVEDGEVAALGKLDHVRAGQLLSLDGRAEPGALALAPRPPVQWLAIAPRSRNDEVRMSDALARLLEEDPALSLAHDPDTRETLLAGQGEGHLKLALMRLKNRFGLEAATAPPSTPYRETISTAVQQHARHKKQTGGHGQFADVAIEVRPLPRGEGFAFASRIAGGVVPRQWIPAVEQGVRDAMAKGPLGFPVTDVAVTLVDGAFHSVDSSEMAFRLAGRLAMDEALRRAGACLLEPVEKVMVDLPSACTSAAISTLSARRGQVLGFAPRPGWTGWDRVEAYLPRAERYELNGELRSLSQGLASFTFAFDHLSELTGRLREEATQRARACA